MYYGFYSIKVHKQKIILDRSAKFNCPIISKLKILPYIAIIIKYTKCIIACNVGSISKFDFVPDFTGNVQFYCYFFHYRLKAKYQYS